MVNKKMIHDKIKNMDYDKTKKMVYGKIKKMDLNSKEVTGWVLAIFGALSFGVLLVILFNILKDDKE